MKIPDEIETKYFNMNLADGMIHEDDGIVYHTGADELHSPSAEEVIRTFKHWRYNKGNLTLERKGEGYGHSYYVDLENMVDGASFGQLIMHVTQKTWATPEMVGELVCAVQLLIGRSGFVYGDKKLNVKNFLKPRKAR
jgi:hypothetical protein